jgi:chromosome segregation ATPase
MQQLQELSQDQEKLNEALKQLRRQGGGSLDRRLQGQLKDLAAEQQRIREQLEQTLKEMGSAQGMLGRLDDVSKKLDEVSKKLAAGQLDDETVREQEWALTRLLDSQRSLRERDFGKQRQSKPGEELGELAPPSGLPEGTEKTERDLREDLLKALERRYPPKYEDLIRRYFRELSREAPAPDLP